MDAEEMDPQRFVLLATVFEGGLVVLACGAGWLVGYPPTQHLKEPTPFWAHLLWGLGATLPLVAGAAALLYFPPPTMRGFQQYVLRQIVPLFRGANVAQIAAIALLAGIGEELLFRGLIQAGLAAWLDDASTGPWLALGIAAAAFGACHWLNTWYAVLATIIGLYLGMLFLLTGNLLAPIITHAAYDFVILVLLRAKDEGQEEGLGAGD